MFFFGDEQIKKSLESFGQEKFYQIFFQMKLVKTGIKPDQNWNLSLLIVFQQQKKTKEKNKRETYFGMQIDDLFCLNFIFYKLLPI